MEAHFAGTKTNFVGYLQGLELAAAFASADAFVFPSRTETLGLVLLEAMAAGCPVVAARSGGIPDIVTDGVNGYLFEPDDPMAQSPLPNPYCLLPQRERNYAIMPVMKPNSGLAAATQQLQNYYRHVLESEYGVSAA